MIESPQQHGEPLDFTLEETTGPVQSLDQITAKTDYKKTYDDHIVEMSPEEVLEAMSLEEALDIQRVIENKGNLGQVILSESAANCRFNIELYDDNVEDFIAESSVLMKLIDEVRNGDHKVAEKMRLYRSARARIYFTVLEEEYGE